MKLFTRFLSGTGARIGLLILLAIVFAALFAPVLAPGDPWDMVAAPFQPPMSNGQNFLGSDALGRDIYTGLLHGARASIYVGVVSTVFATLFGMVVGIVAGFAGGVVENILMRLTEVFQTLPSFILAILLVAAFQPSLNTIVGSIAVVTWPPIARLTRSEFSALKRRDYVLAALSSGRGFASVAFKEILPNALPPIIVMASLGIATAILLESAISFMGLGDPNQISWGYMVGAGRTVLRSAWWICVFPGIAIMLLVLSVNLVSEGLNDALDPRLTKKELA